MLLGTRKWSKERKDADEWYMNKHTTLWACDTPSIWELVT